MPAISRFVEQVDPVRTDAELHSFLTELGKYGAVPVTDGKDLAGMIFIEDVSRREYPVNSKAQSLLTKVTHLQADADVVSAAAALIQGRHRALPVYFNDSYAGIITDRSILRAIAEKPLGRKIAGLMNEPVTIPHTANVGKARSLMRDKTIGKLPIVDKRGELVGIVDWSNFILLERPKDTGRRDRKSDYLQDYKMSITTVMDSNPLVIDKNEDLSVVARKMNEHGCSYAVVIEEKKPIGIVTCEDLLETLAAQAPREGVYVQITGAEHLDGFEREKLHSNVDESVRKLARIYAGIEYFFVHVKRHETQGKKIKFSVRTRLMTPVGTFYSRAHSYNLATATDDAMDKLERIVKQDHARHKKAERRTPRSRKDR